MLNVVDVKDRVKGAVYGHLIGDAFGVPYEFKPANEIPEFDPANLSMQVPDGYDRSWKVIPPGTWSDDGSQMLCLYEQMKEGYDQDKFVKLLLRWRYTNYMWMVGKNFDCGMQTARTLDELFHGAKVSDLSFDEFENGNGSLIS